MPSGSDGRPRNLLQRDRRAPLCSAARSGRSSPLGLRIRDRQRVSALVSTSGRLSRLLPSYSGHGRATLIHFCGHFPHEDLEGRRAACSGAGTSRSSPRSDPENASPHREPQSLLLHAQQSAINVCLRRSASYVEVASTASGSCGSCVSRSGSLPMGGRHPQGAVMLRIPGTRSRFARHRTPVPADRAG